MCSQDKIINKNYDFFFFLFSFSDDHTWALLTAECWAESEKIIMVRNLISSSEVLKYSGKPVDGIIHIIICLLYMKSQYNDSSYYYLILCFVRQHVWKSLWSIPAAHCLFWCDCHWDSSSPPLPSQSWWVQINRDWNSIFKILIHDKAAAAKQIINLNRIILVKD